MRLSLLTSPAFLIFLSSPASLCALHCTVCPGAFPFDADPLVRSIATGGAAPQGRQRRFLRASKQTRQRTGSQSPPPPQHRTSSGGGGIHSLSIDTDDAMAASSLAAFGWPGIAADGVLPDGSLPTNPMAQRLAAERARRAASTAPYGSPTNAAEEEELKVEQEVRLLSIKWTLN